MNDTITSFAFPATAAAERTIKAHWANIPTYLLIAFVILLTACKNVLAWLTAQLDRAPEYVIRLKLAKVRTQRRFVRVAIKAEQTRLTVAPLVTAAIDRGILPFLIQMLEAGIVL